MLASKEAVKTVTQGIFATWSKLNAGHPVHVCPESVALLSTLFCQTWETRCPYAKALSSEDYATASACLCTSTIHEENFSSHLRQNWTGYLTQWLYVLHVKLMHHGGLGPILRGNGARQDVRVHVQVLPARGVGRTGSAGTAAERMPGINQCNWHGASHQVASCSVSIGCELIKTYERKADAKVKCILRLERRVRSQESVWNPYWCCCF